MPEVGPPTPALPTAEAISMMRPPSGRVRITGGLWADYQRANAEAGIPAGLVQLEASGVLDNFRRAAGADLAAIGPRFADSDAYKWLEAAAWESQRSGVLVPGQGRVGDLVAAAQRPDGYLDTMSQVPWQDLVWSHEHYLAGHLIQAALAQHRACGATGLLRVACKVADLLVERFGPGRDERLDGHPEVETALVELYRETSERSYLDLAAWMVERRGTGQLTFHEFESSYFCDRVPIRSQEGIEGHAVRAVYLAAGATDVAVETGDVELLAVLQRQFATMLATRTYLTGGIGARWEQESFGDAFELPSDRAYAETCAAIGVVQWAWRLLLATGEAHYGDVIERVLLNAFLSGVSASGDRYLYVNPLEVHGDGLAHDGRSPAHGRRAWFDCACCPPNVMRLLASLEGYLAAQDEDGLSLIQYAPAELAVAWGVLSVETSYPHGSVVKVSVSQGASEDWTLRLRIPGWASGVRVDAAGLTVRMREGWAEVRGAWQAGTSVELSWQASPQVVVGDPRIAGVRGAGAIEVGPVVYAFEEVDNPGLAECEIAGEPVLVAEGMVEIPGRRRRTSAAAWPYRRRGEPDPWEPVVLRAVPYFTWGERSPGAMSVWLPLSPPDQPAPNAP